MTGGVEEVDGGVGGVDDGGFGEDGDAACAFHGVGVEEGVAVVYAAGFAQLAGGVEDGFGECGFACVDVCEDSGYDALHGCHHTSVCSCAVWVVCAGEGL